MDKQARFKESQKMQLGYFDKQRNWRRIAVITQQCECCLAWVNQEKLVWDLEANRLICWQCYKEKK